MHKAHMTSVYVEGIDKTHQISDWSIFWDDQRHALQLKCVFPSTKFFIRPLSVCSVVPTRELGEMLLKKRNSISVQPIEKATIYGERYAVVQYAAATRPYIFDLAGIEFLPTTAMKETPVFRYLMAIANTRRNRAGSPDQRTIAENIVRQLETLAPSPDTALHAYCNGENARRIAEGSLIFPFGVNESQLAAVERAFGHQVSVIEGPPGTGKTQTILNILANILLRGKTVAVVSNNNPAVENVYEKLEKVDLGHLVAKLGSTENRNEFFANLPPAPAAGSEPIQSMDEIQATLANLKQHLRDHNLAPQLRAEIDELTIERRYLQQWRDENAVGLPLSLEKYGLSPSKAADLMAYLAYLGTQRIGIKERIELLFSFKIFRAKPFANEARLAVFHALQMHYYDKALARKEAQLRMVITAKGNHARDNTNLRELDSLLAVLDRDTDGVALHEDGRGFIAPYRAQVELSDTHLPADFVKNTVHKFQGRECDEIVFSTVLDKKGHNQRRLDFVDDARMINVAVSRAKKRFTLVTGDDVFSANNGHVAALIRYVVYYAQDAQIVVAPVVSAFDLLYEEYDQALERLRARLRPEDSDFRSEQIVAQLLREALSAASRKGLTCHAQVPLDQVASTTNPALTQQERAFMRNRASCDFVVYFKVGKTPVGVIEVDGGSHETQLQAGRDTLKNSILEKSALRILRLRTVDSGIKQKIAGFLDTWASTSAGEDE